MRDGSFPGRWTMGSRTPEMDPKRLEGMDESVVNGGRLKTAMEHAVGTLGIATVAVVFPIRLLDKGLESWGIAFLR